MALALSKWTRTPLWVAPINRTTAVYLLNAPFFAGGEHLLAVEEGLGADSASGG
jgi:hypothetical protein